MPERRVLMVAAENDELPGGKVGGIGDVVRDVPPALAELGWQVDVVTPSHGFLQRLPGATPLGQLAFDFAGRVDQALFYTVPGKHERPGIRHLVVDYPPFLALDDGQPGIYVNDPPGQPFATDATRFARFCQAVAEALQSGLLPRPDCLHLHDWHAAFLLIPRHFDPRYRTLANLRTVYTIHNLALQGVRPLSGPRSSLDTWYPDRFRPPYPPELLDPRWPDCVNPMAVGIRLADAVHTVSPTYAQEILRPSDPPRAYGGEGLEADLQAAQRQQRIFGILNGCDYPPNYASSRLDFAELLQQLRAELLQWVTTQASVAGANLVALERLRELAAQPAPPSLVLTSVSRVVDQKMMLLLASGSDGRSGLDALLATIGEHGVYLLLGSGDPQYEQLLAATSARQPNFVFLRGFSSPAASALYASGDLFVMPSSYEPCGISQMLALRDGQPCLVHAVGGLRDTITDGVNGFAFNGDSLTAQVDGLQAACQRAVTLRQTDPPAWESLRQRAATARFPWSDSVRQYVDQLYRA